MKSPFSFFACVAALAMVFDASAKAQSPPIRPVPAPTVAPAPPQEEGPTATIKFADATQIQTQPSDLGRFPLVGLRPREVIDIGLDFPASSMSTSVTAQPLDGGRIIGRSKDAGKGPGTGFIRFQIGDQPGLYRVLITGLRTRSMFQFWVADTKNPKNNRPVINPGH